MTNVEPIAVNVVVIFVQHVRLRQSQRQKQLGLAGGCDARVCLEAGGKVQPCRGRRLQAVLILREPTVVQHRRRHHTHVILLA